MLWLWAGGEELVTYLCIDAVSSSPKASVVAEFVVVEGTLERAGLKFRAVGPLIDPRIRDFTYG